MSINGEYGFFLEGQWRANTWRGHEGNAYYLIQQNGWLDEWRASKSASDFLVVHKSAIQLGSNGISKKLFISNSGGKNSELSLRYFIRENNLDDDYVVEWIK